MPVHVDASWEGRPLSVSGDDDHPRPGSADGNVATTVVSVWSGVSGVVVRQQGGDVLPVRTGYG